MISNSHDFFLPFSLCPKWEKMGAQQSMPLIEPPSDPQVLSSEFFGFLQQFYNNFNYTERSLRIFESHFIQRGITHTDWKESHGICPCSRQSQNSTKLQNMANAAGLASSALITTVLRVSNTNKGQDPCPLHLLRKI